MKMQVAGHAGTRCLTKIQPEVNSMGTIDLAKNSLHLLCRLHHLRRFSRVKLRQGVRMAKRNEEHVPT